MSFGVWKTFGRVSYATGLAFQESVAGERERNLRPDTLLLLEHDPTITLGRRSTEADVLWNARELESRGIPIVRVARGGQATYHGPGQLVGYPVARLSKGGRGVREFVAALEGVLLETARRFAVAAQRRSGHPGVWVGERKLGSIGIQVRRGVSRHGFALNVAMDLEPFQAIVPCGCPGLVPIDLSRAARVRIDRAEAETALLSAWRAIFGDIEEEIVNGCEARG
ncbi:MAG: lipoyl(octanoyl) transferase LipB [Candidatus Binatia bacterium]